MSPFSTLLVVLVVFVSCASAASINFYSGASCANSVFSQSKINVPNTTPTCVAVSGIASFGSAQITCATSNGQSAFTVASFTGSTCAGTSNGLGAGNGNGACSTMSGVTGVATVSVNCNSAFSTQTLSIAVMVILAILAMIAM